MAIDERSEMGRRATLGLAAVLAATVMTGAVGIAGLSERSAAPPPPAAAATVRVAPVVPPAPPAAARKDDGQEVD